MVGKQRGGARKDTIRARRFRREAETEETTVPDYTSHANAMNIAQSLEAQKRRRHSTTPPTPSPIEVLRDRIASVRGTYESTAADMTAALDALTSELEVARSRVRELEIRDRNWQERARPRVGSPHDWIVRQLEAFKTTPDGEPSETMSVEDAIDVVNLGFESQLSARAPRHPDEAPEHDEPNWLFCYDTNGTAEFGVGWRVDEGHWNALGADWHIEHSRVRWWLPVSELLTAEPVEARAPVVAPGELALSAAILHLRKIHERFGPGAVDLVCDAAESWASVTEPLTKLADAWNQYIARDLTQEEFEGAVAELVEFPPVAPAPIEGGDDHA